MSGRELDILPALYLRWTINTQRFKPGRALHSSVFQFQGVDWSFNYWFVEQQHILGLQKTVCGKCRNNFNVSVQPEDSNKKQDLLLETRFSLDDFRTEKNKRIWYKSHRLVYRSLPEFCGNLQMQVVLKAEEYIPLAETKSVATQAEYDFPVSCLEILSEDLAQLMSPGLEPDMEFQCSDQSFKAHKLIICSRSPVFASMMASDMVEGRMGVVKIPNIEPDVFRRLLKHIYTGTLDELTFEVALSLYEAGDQYAVRGLPKRCSKFLLEHLTSDNACGVLVVAEAHCDKSFKEAVVSFMVDNEVPQVYRSWPEFCRGHLELAVEVLNRLCSAVTK